MCRKMCGVGVPHSKVPARSNARLIFRRQVSVAVSSRSDKPHAKIFVPYLRSRARRRSYSPVSYTHLDVYKRQARMSSSAPRPCRRTTIKNGLRVGPQTAGSASSSRDNDPPNCTGPAVGLPLHLPSFVALIKQLQSCMQTYPTPKKRPLEKRSQIQGVFFVKNSSDRFRSPSSLRKWRNSFLGISRHEMAS